jgi:hypothetical protein
MAGEESARSAFRTLSVSSGLQKAQYEGATGLGRPALQGRERDDGSKDPPLQLNQDAELPDKKSRDPCSPGESPALQGRGRARGIVPLQRQGNKDGRLKPAATKMGQGETPFGRNGVPGAGGARILLLPCSGNIL